MYSKENESKFSIMRWKELSINRNYLYGIAIILKECIGITFSNHKLLYTVLFFALPITTICFLDKLKKNKGAKIT